MSYIRSSLFIPALMITLGACSSPSPIHTAKAVDLERFMGDWYVIANIPTFIEKNAHNAMESYRLAEDGTVATTFS
jgi:apolipoprotein D and lipocalin family protein